MRSGESVVWSGREGPFEEPRVALDPGPAELLSRRRDRFKSYPDQLNYSVTNATLTRRLRQRGGLLLSGNKPELQQRLRASDDFEIYSRFRGEFAYLMLPIYLSLACCYPYVPIS